MNLYYESDASESFDHNRITDDDGWAVDGKWLAEHERNLSNSGSVYDSRGFAKDPAYESYLKYNNFPEDDPRYMTDEQYAEYEAQENGDWDD